MTTSPPPAIEVRDLTVDYPDGNVRALDHVTFKIPGGQYAAIMGPSGSGKSTLLAMIGTLGRPTSGRVIIDGVAIDDSVNLDALRSGKLGFVFQSFYLLPTLTALENVQVPMFATALPRRDRIRRAEELIDAVGMTSRAKHLPGQLSVGQRQRIAIARALANDPKIILADEPTGNLDTATAAEILELFGSLHRTRGVTLVTVTHSDTVAAAADRILRVRDGRIESDTAGRPGGHQTP